MSQRVHERVTFRDVVRDDPLLPFDLAATLTSIAAFLVVFVV